MPPAMFETGRAYKHTYFMFLDAAGYSTVIAANPLDRAGDGFNLFRERAVNRVQRVARIHRCERAQLWQWRGDGGFFVIHDDNESVARDVAIGSAETFLRLDMNHLRDEFRQLGVAGELHVRLAIHRGVFHYLGDHHAQSVHSADVNFAAHLEEAAPRDCLVISHEVYQVCGPLAERFVFVGHCDGRKVYLLSTPRADADARRAWLARHGPSGWQAIHAFHERPSQQVKAGFVGSASHRVLDLGTALNTFSNYLVTTERPAWYRTAVLAFLRRGGVYDCVLLDPKSRTADDLAAARDEDIPTKIGRSMDRFAEFKSRHGAAADNMRVYQTSSYAGLHALAADLDEPDGAIMYSPYVGYTLPAASRLARGDMPHYLVTAAAETLYAKIRDLLLGCTAPDSLHRVL
jgi:class 3 adenylate cyclase